MTRKPAIIDQLHESPPILQSQYLYRGFAAGNSEDEVPMGTESADISKLKKGKKKQSIWSAELPGHGCIEYISLFPVRSFSVLEGKMLLK